MASTFNTETKRKKLVIRHAPYWDKISKGRSIGYRKGTKQIAWMARMDVGGKFKYTTFDNSEAWNYEDALLNVTEWFTTLIGIDPSIKDLTMKGVIDHYEQRMCIEKTPKYAKENAARIRKHMSDNFNKTLSSKITKRQIVLFRDEMVSTEDDADTIRKSKVSANRVLNVLKAALNLAYSDKIIGNKSAWDTVKPFESVGESRKLYLTDKQVSDFLKSSNSAFKNLVKACVLTGNRVGSLTNALVNDFDEKQGTLRLESKKGRGDVHTWNCYLSDAGISFFKEMSKNKLPKAALLPNDLGEHWGKNGYRRIMLTVKKDSKMPVDFDLYAFRHYHISKALLAGVQAQIIAENCGTSVRMIEKHYGKFMGKDRRSMINTIQLGMNGI